MFNSIIEFVRSINWVDIASMVGLSIAVVAAQVIFYLLVRKLFKKIINPFLIDKGRNSFKGIKFHNLVLLSPARLLNISFLASRVLMYAIYLASFYISLTLLFSIYPGTRNLASTLFHGLLDPFLSLVWGFVSYIPNLLSIIVIVIVTRYFVKFMKLVLNEIEAGRMVVNGFYPDWAPATFNLLRFLAYAFMFVLIFPLLPDSETAAFRGVSVFLGVLISLGSTTVIANVVAGLVLTYMRSFKLGDRVKVGEVLGDVVEKTPFAVRLQTNKKEIVTVPNGSLLSSNVVNYSTSGDEKNGIIIYMPISVSYDIPLRHAIELITAAALKTSDVLDQPSPFVLVKNLGSNATELELNVYTNEPERQPRILSDINKNIRELFEQNGISMVLPSLERTV